MFINMDKPRHYVHDYAFLSDIICNLNKEGMRKSQIVTALCSKGCNQSTAYANINTFSLTTNDIALTLHTLKYIGMDCHNRISCSGNS